MINYKITHKMLKSFLNLVKILKIMTMKKKNFHMNSKFIILKDNLKKVKKHMIHYYYYFNVNFSKNIFNNFNLIFI